MAKTRRRNNKVRRTKSRRGGVPRLNWTKPVEAMLLRKLSKIKSIKPYTTHWSVEPGQNGPVRTLHTQEPYYGIGKPPISNYERAQTGLPSHDPKFKFNP